MSSIIDSFREVLSDSKAFIKLIIWAIPVYYSYYFYTVHDSTDFYLISGMTSFFLTGFLVKVTSNSINEKDVILPSLNPFALAWTSLKVSIATVPVNWILSVLATLFCLFVHIAPQIDIALDIIVWLFVVSVFLSMFLMYSRSERILDAYNFKMLFEKGGELIVSIIVFVIQIILINLVTTAVITYLLWLLFGFTFVFYFFIAIAIVFNIAMTGHYMAQLHYEIFSYDNGNS